MEPLPESETAFFMTAQDLPIRVERGGDGPVVGFTLVRGANSYPAKRVAPKGQPATSGAQPDRTHRRPLPLTVIEETPAMFDRLACRIALLTLSSLALAACAGMSDRPTADIVASKLAKPRQVVRIDLPGTVATIAGRLETTGKPCTASTIRASGDMPSGSGGIVSISPTIRQNLERGVTNDGGVWLALRMDSSLHLVAFGVLLEQKDAERVEAKVFPADSQKVPAITAALESGMLFCAWRELNYPYD